MADLTIEKTNHTLIASKFILIRPIVLPVPEIILCLAKIFKTRKYTTFLPN